MGTNEGNNGQRKEVEEGSRVHQLAPAASDQVGQVLARVQVHPQAASCRQGYADHARQPPRDLPALRLLSAPPGGKGRVVGGRALGSDLGVAAAKLVLIFPTARRCASPSSS